ncbi:lipoprotein [Bacteroides pyogenes DSM 20611 = JCM 6294]|nr:lipoprotein [Bacteroides pyogenes DSM 20611 = JCM 6294]
MNGLELCCKIKNDLNISHIPFILLTAYHSPQNMNDSYKTGADAFLPKPFELDGLLALIYNQIKTREQIRLRYQQKEIPSLHETAFSNADETFLLKLNEIITDNINDPDLDVSLIADQLCISRSLLFSKLKALTGMGVVDYIKAERINRAVLLMKTTSLSLTEISEQIGFSTLRYFSRVFKEAKGIIPSEFKKQLTQDPEDEKE